MLDNMELGMTQTEAARAAGYADPARDAYHVLHRTNVAAELAKRRAIIAKKLQVTKDDVIEGLARAIKDAVLLSDPQAQIAGWREIAKIIGAYAPEVKKLELSSAHRRVLTHLETLSDEDLLRVADGERNILEGEFEELSDGA